MKDTDQDTPGIQEALKSLGDAEVFIALDLKSGDWQIRMHENAKKYTTFTMYTKRRYI